MKQRRWFSKREGKHLTLDVEPVAPERLRVRVGDGERTFDVTLLGRAGATTVSVDGRVLTLFPTRDGFVVERSRARVELQARPGGAAAGQSGGAEGDGVVRAPMPGRVLKLLVAEGDSVTAGTALAVVEAMKMENELSASRSGIVRRIRVRAGDTVERDAALMEIE